MIYRYYYYYFSARLFHSLYSINRIQKQKKPKTKTKRRQVNNQTKNKDDKNETHFLVWLLLKKNVAYFTGIVGIDCGTGATTMAVPAMKENKKERKKINSLLKSFFLKKFH